MRKFLRTFLVAAAAALAAAQAMPQSSDQGSGNRQADARQVFALANEAREQAGVGKLDWDISLAQAALAHCLLMAQRGPISHQYPGEPDVSVRTAQAGAHFSVIEENVAVGPSADAIHEEWMQSPGHRANLLSPEVDRVGVAVVAARGVLYAVADYSRGVEQLSAAEIEVRVSSLVRVSGLTVLRDRSAARRACATDEGVPQTPGGPIARFVMRWQAGDLDRLPQQLAEKLASGNYRAAAVGGCVAQSGAGSFSAYRVAVLLY